MSLKYHHGFRLQQGRGIGSIFSGLLRFLRPIASMGLSAGKKVLTSDIAKKLGAAALDVGSTAAKNIAVDLLEGKAFKDTANEQLEEAKKVIANTIKGSGHKKKRKRTEKICPSSKKAKYNLLK